MSLVKKLFGTSNPTKQLAKQLSSPFFTPSIYRKDPFLNNFFQNFDSDFFQQPNSLLASLPVDVKESDKEYELVADIPGFAKNEVQCSIDEDSHLLTLKGEKKESKEEGEGNFIIKERYYNTFTRTFDIPSNVKLDQIKASLKDGQLKLTIPKSGEKVQENVQHVKNIEIAE